RGELLRQPRARIQPGLVRELDCYKLLSESSIQELLHYDRCDVGSLFYVDANDCGEVVRGDEVDVVVDREPGIADIQLVLLLDLDRGLGTSGRIKAAKQEAQAVDSGLLERGGHLVRLLFVLPRFDERRRVRCKRKIGAENRRLSINRRRLARARFEAGDGLRLVRE